MRGIVNFLLSPFKSPTSRPAVRPFWTRSLRGLFNVSIAFALTFGSSVRAEDPVEPDQASGSIRVVSVDASVPDLNVQIETETIDASEAPAELAKALETDAETVLFSSDDSALLAQAARSASTGPRDRLFLLPFGKAIRKTADLVGGANQLLRNSGLYFVNTFRQDKIGVSITTFTLANEIFRWVHVTTASNFVITSNIIYSIVWSALFLNKDTWSKATKPLQKTFRKLFKMSEVIPETPTAQDIAVKFLSGLTLSMVLNTGRATLIGIDQFAHGVFDPLNLTMPFVMGAVMTAVGFSWSEMMGSIDPDRFPRTKKIMRLVMNSRSCLISYFAASAMLMNPAHYGIVPWLTVTVSGVTGLLLYANAKHLLPLLENRTAGKCETLFRPSLQF